MPFTQSTFAPVAANSTAAPSHWSYSTDDTMAEVLSIGYFLPKRFQLRDGDYIYVSASDLRGILTYKGIGTAPDLFAITDPELVLFAFNNEPVEPQSLDIPIKVSFGPAKQGFNDIASLSADGTITINETGYFDLIATFDIGRFGSSGSESAIFIRGLVNDQQFGQPLFSLIDNPSITESRQFEIVGRLDPGDTIKIEMYRDSMGINEGGLYPHSSTIGWGVSPSARFRLVRFRK